MFLCKSKFINCVKFLKFLRRAYSLLLQRLNLQIIGVPDKMVGLIIGRGGEQISRLQVSVAENFFDSAPTKRPGLSGLG
jgi:hypothetical protein